MLVKKEGVSNVVSVQLMIATGAIVKYYAAQLTDNFEILGLIKYCIVRGSLGRREVLEWQILRTR